MAEAEEVKGRSLPLCCVAGSLKGRKFMYVPTAGTGAIKPALGRGEPGEERGRGPASSSSEYGELSVRLWNSEKYNGLRNGHVMFLLAFLVEIELGKNEIWLNFTRLFSMIIHTFPIVQ